MDLSNRFEEGRGSFRLQQNALDPETYGLQMEIGIRHSGQDQAARIARSFQQSRDELDAVFISESEIQKNDVRLHLNDVHSLRTSRGLAGDRESGLLLDQHAQPMKEHF